MSLFADLKFAVRSLSRTKGFALTVILTLARVVVGRLAVPAAR